MKSSIVSKLFNFDISFGQYRELVEGIRYAQFSIFRIIQLIRENPDAEITVEKNTVAEETYTITEKDFNLILNDFPTYKPEGLELLPMELQLTFIQLEVKRHYLKAYYPYYHLLCPLADIVHLATKGTFEDLINKALPTYRVPSRKVLFSIIAMLDDNKREIIARKISEINPMIDFEDVIEIFEKLDIEEFKKVVIGECDKTQKLALNKVLSNIYEYGESLGIVHPNEEISGNPYSPESSKLREEVLNIPDALDYVDLLRDEENPCKFYSLAKVADYQGQVNIIIMGLVYHFIQRKEAKFQKYIWEIQSKLDEWSSDEDFTKLFNLMGELGHKEFTDIEENLKRPIEKKELQPSQFILPDSYFDLAYEEMKDTYIPQLDYEIVKQGPEKLQELINYLAAQGYIENTPENKNLLAFRMTGRNKPEGDLPVIRWNNPNNNHGYELIYLIGAAFESKSKFKDMQRFFEGPEFPDKKLASYANSAQTQFRRQLHSFYPTVFKLKSNEIE